MSTLQKYPSSYLFTLYLTSTSLWLVFLLQPFYYGPRLMHAQTTQDRQLLLVQSGFGLFTSCATGLYITICAWHIQNNQPWHGHILLQYVLKGATNATPSASTQMWLQPITADMLNNLFWGLNHNSNLDSAVYAIATIAFYGQLCMGKICTSREAYTTFNRATLLSCWHLKPPHTNTCSCMLHLPWAKVKQTVGEDVAICWQHGITNLVAALEWHLLLNDITNPDMAISSHTGNHKLLTILKFIKQCNDIWGAQGRARFSGHSFWIGSTTFYLLQGINPDIVCVMGQWSSDTFIWYSKLLHTATSNPVYPAAC